MSEAVPAGAEPKSGCWTMGAESMVGRTLANPVESDLVLAVDERRPDGEDETGLACAGGTSGVNKAIE